MKCRKIKNNFFSGKVMNDKCWNNLFQLLGLSQDRAKIVSVDFAVAKNDESASNLHSPNLFISL